MNAITMLRAAEECDRAGQERPAIALYEQAIDAGLPVDELRSALHGLGSTLRAVGRYEDALRVLGRGIREFPDDKSFAPFMAMALYNAQRPKEAASLLLQTLVDTTSSGQIKKYARAIRLYAQDLDRLW